MFSGSQQLEPPPGSDGGIPTSQSGAILQLPSVTEPPLNNKESYFSWVHVLEERPSSSPPYSTDPDPGRDLGDDLGQGSCLSLVPH